MFRLRSWRRVALFLIVGVLLAGAAPDDPKEAVVEVIEVDGILDSATVAYLSSSIEQAVAKRELVVVQLNVPAVVVEMAELEELADLIADPPLPLVIWIGPAPARVGGGAAQLLALARVRTAAPGIVIENWEPAIVGQAQNLLEPPDGLGGPLVVTEPVPGLVDLVAPSIRQLLQDLHEAKVDVGGELVTLQTLTETDGGLTTVPVSFRKPGFIHRFLHLGAQPAAAFFFLVAGLTVATFEFYALGPGIAAAVAAISLLLSGYGMSILPVRPWSLGLSVLGLACLTFGYQQGGVLALTILGTAALIIGGLNFTSGAPQIEVGVLGIAASVVAVLFFYLLAMPSVGRARFSTPTLGRHHLIGRIGKALGALSPDGVVEVDGGRWPATAHREANIALGDPVRVVGVDGWQLEVDREREN
ncbi:MAG TPA: NfeD family protein [Acidimicrobiia bacterium]|nr:NfeD family protein [Acidimicrobiia bacterium]